MKKWFITGISSGLGKALAEAALRKGHFVIGTMRDLQQVEAFNQTHASKATAVALDLNDPQGVEQTIAGILADHGPIDVLVNNAGTGFVGAVEETSSEEVRRVFETNFFGTLRITQLMLPHFRERKQGHIIQISSHGGIKAFAGFGIYNASKFALEGFSEALAQEVGPLGIRVAIVEPGPFRTRFAGEGLQEAETIIEDYALTAGSFREKLKSVHGKQPGDPEKAALAIIEWVETPSSSLRLPLGSIALQTIAAKVQSVNQDLERHRQQALAADYT
ncbi:oxidoreductase [Croceiramulus getboli]|nr:oxidoreductase [Flavobacteriaceae bacterium YJPT1-3]